MKIGFNNGIFYRTNIDRYSQKNIDAISLPETNTVELFCCNVFDLHTLAKEEVTKYKHFTYFTLHAPASNTIYKEDSHTYKRLEEIQKIHEKFPLQNIVLHADTIQNTKPFTQFNHLPWSIENMDHRKPKGQSIHDIQKLMDQYSFNLTLDIQHCAEHDPSGKLATQFQETFFDKIVEYHISGNKGLQEEHPHYPLYKTQQREILSQIQKKDALCILEGTFDYLDGPTKEIEFLKKNNFFS